MKDPRGEKILNWGVNVMRLPSDRKSNPEVEFIDEEGIGLGPTLEFLLLFLLNSREQILLCGYQMIRISQ